MREAFIDRKFQQKSLLVIARANEILDGYRARGRVTTLRQLYYQFVVRGWLKNKQTEYDRLGEILSAARLAGLVDWSVMEDRLRNVNVPAAWTEPVSILRGARDAYQENPWIDQEYAPEVWIEKDSLIGVIADVCEELRVPYLACRGYMSQSEAYAAGKRFAAVWQREYRAPIVFHLGDHDPSGMDMSRDNSERIDMLARTPVEFRRIGLSMDQIEEYSLPSNPAKETDYGRIEKYREEFGDESWELDALDPDTLIALIREAVDSITDLEKWNASMEREERHKHELTALVKEWDTIKKRKAFRQ